VSGGMLLTRRPAIFRAGIGMRVSEMAKPAGKFEKRPGTLDLAQYSRG